MLLALFLSSSAASSAMHTHAESECSPLLQLVKRELGSSIHMGELEYADAERDSCCTREALVRVEEAVEMAPKAADTALSSCRRPEKLQVAKCVVSSSTKKWSDGACSSEAFGRGAAVREA